MNEKIIDEFINSKVIGEKTNTIPVSVDNKIAEVLKNLNEHKIETTLINSKGRRKYKRYIKAILIACLCFIISIGVAVANIPTFNNIMHVISPEIATMLQKISNISEYDGIRMEVVGAMNDNEMVILYITIQDLIGDRIDETLDLYDFTISGLRIFTSEIVHFDEDTKIATLKIQANGGKGINGRMVSFRLDSFLSKKERFKEVETGIELLEIKNNQNPLTIPLSMNNIPGGGGELYSEFKSRGTIEILKTDEMNNSIPNIDFVHISNIGVIDNRLHVQTKWTREGVDDHGYLYLVDSEGNRLDVNETNIYFGTDTSGNAVYGREYVEHIYDINDIALDNVRLLGYFVKNTFTSGKWKTNFRIKSVGQEIKKECNINFGSWIANRIYVSQVGVTLIGSGETSDINEISVKVKMIDGEVDTFSRRSFSENNAIRLKFTTDLPLDVSNIKSVVVNGVEVYVKD